MSTLLSNQNGIERLLPTLPLLLQESPDVTKVYDTIRFELNESEKYDEFCWFAREYPRCYRFHVDGATYRLQSIYNAMSDISIDLQKRREENDKAIAFGIKDQRAEQVYWDFESFLSEICVSLDLLARCISPAFPIEAPPSFNRFCKWGEDHPLISLFQKARKNWVSRLKDYRDCFTHYTPVDTWLSIDLVRYASGWTIRAKLPLNPNAREILRFRFSRRKELLRYAIHVYKQFLAFDRAVARFLIRSYRDGSFPVKLNSLFSVGQRSRPT